MSEIDHRQQYGVHMSKQMLISGLDKPDDQQEHRLESSLYFTFECSKTQVSFGGVMAIV